MSTVIAHNIPAINANKNLYQSNQALNKSLEKLSSGYRINVGADGPADLVISEQLRAQSTGLERAVRNTTEASNVLSIAEGALNEMNSILKKMKALAIHAANSGITSPEQVEADQAEMDSSIQTLERIANTTKYSDQYLLNGSKDITYNISTEVKGTQNNSMVNQGLSNFNQIFKREGYAVSFGFTGAIGADSLTNIGDKANMDKQAAKAYLEIDAYDGTISQVDKDGNLTKGQSFILTGTLGSRQFRFSEGANISQVVSAIKNVSGSTGIDASLTFNRNQQIQQTTTLGAASTGNVSGLVTTARTADTATVYDNYFVKDDGSKAVILSDVSGSLTGLQYGKNTDGQGNIYIKVTGNNSYEAYKDASLSKESLIGAGVSGGAFTEMNNSGLSGLQVTFGADTPKFGSVAVLSTGGVLLDSGAGANTSVGGIMKDTFQGNTSVASGVQLGVNTSAEGKLYLKSVVDADNKVMVYAYKDSAMRAEDLVAQTTEAIDGASIANTNSIVLNSVWNDEHTASTQLGLTLSVKDNSIFTAQGSHNGEIQFSNLGARVYASDYGSNSFIKVQQFEGGLFTYYDQKDNKDSATLIDAGGTGTTFQMNGQDATLTVNGQQMKTNGLDLNLATPDIMAKIKFNAGHSGTTTIAQVGYGEGSVFTKNTSLTFAENDAAKYTGADAGFSGLLNNAGHNTNETVNHFQGGMQLQLGEGSGDQERTVISIKSMSTANMGRIEVTKQFDPSKAVIETKTLSIQDVMGGQLASLGNDPVLAMKIIDQAIKDVSDLRAQIGSVQSNMLDTNANNLRVAIENITKTESDIRDTDMAAQMTEFTKDQVLSNAGMSMLSQANAQSQSVLQLLR